MLDLGRARKGERGKKGRENEEEENGARVLPALLRLNSCSFFLPSSPVPLPSFLIRFKAMPDEPFICFSSFVVCKGDKNNSKKYKKTFFFHLFEVDVFNYTVVSPLFLSSLFSVSLSLCAHASTRDKPLIIKSNQNRKRKKKKQLSLSLFSSPVKYLTQKLSTSSSPPRSPRGSSPSSPEPASSQTPSSPGTQPRRTDKPPRHPRQKQQVRRSAPR